MSKFNTKAVEEGRFPNTVNMAGGVAYKVEDAKKELASAVLASMLNTDSYYEKDVDRINRVFNLVANLEDKEFAAKAMIYARQVGNLRSISHVLANALVENAAGHSYVRKAIRRAIQRPDDMTEMAAIWFSRHETMLPNSMRRAFKDVFESGVFNAFQLKRYSGTSNKVKLKDLVKLVHPVDTKSLFGALLNDELDTIETVESMLASGKSAADTFEHLLIKNKLGYMAAVKNIRNALETGISDEALDLWCDLISDPDKVHKSRMLPFRFFDAWENVKNLNVDHFKIKKVKKAFNQALTHSARNLELRNPGEKIAIIIDESGSMGGNPWKHAIVLVAVMSAAFGTDNVVAYKFGSTCTKLDFADMSPIDIIDKTDFGSGATYFSKPMEALTKSGTKVDKVIILTDMQMYHETPAYSMYLREDAQGFYHYWKEYQRINPKVKMLFWDLQGHGAGTPLKLKGNVLLASGFSDKLLSVIPKMWEDQNALIKEIEQISI